MANSDNSNALQTSNFWDKQVSAFRSLMLAIKNTQEAKASGDPSVKPTYLSDWFKQNWVFAITWGLAIIVIIKLLDQDNNRTRKGHHGVNKYGEKY